MKRSKPLRANPETTRAWQERSRKPLSPTSPPKRSVGVRRVNRKRAAKLWLRNFHSEEFVFFTKAVSPCAFDGKRPCECCHMRSRGAGGDWRWVLPGCHDCHAEMHAKGLRTFLAERGLTMEAVGVMLVQHQASFASWQEGDSGI